MLIESRIRRNRKGVLGTDVNFPGGVSYRFAPNPDLTEGDPNAHVCEIEDKAHIQRLLSITEGYCIYGADEQPAVEPEEDEPDLGPAPPDDSGPDADDDDPTLKVDDTDPDPAVEMARTVSQMVVHEATEQLPGLTDEQLVDLVAFEAEGENRPTLLEAIGLPVV